MNSMTRLATLSLYATFAGMLSFAAPGTHAADTPPAAPAAVTAQAPVAEPQELEEIWVRGKSLSRAIADAEDDVYQLYNKLNKDSDYDITCGYMSLQRGSMIMRRACTPGFFADYVRGGLVRGRLTVFGSFFPGFQADSTTQCNQMAPIRDLYASSDTYVAACAATDSTYYAPPTYEVMQTLPAAMTTERRQAFASNVLKVIHSDPVLLEKATHLARLYQEMESVKSQYVKVKRVDQGKAAHRSSNPHDW